MRRALLLAAFALACGPSYRPAPTQVKTSRLEEKSGPYFGWPWPDDRRLSEGAVPIRRFPNPGSSMAPRPLRPSLTTSLCSPFSMSSASPARRWPARPSSPPSPPWTS